MAQETRKDPRAKVLTMTVRYKSATLDEFIEHHSHDVSRGGMFIKTPSPFPPGTLLKFEVKIAQDQRVMQGVGRVVWKREPPDAGGDDRPAGMGVKFIKIDEESRTIIDRLIASRAQESGAYEAGQEVGGTAEANRVVAPSPSDARPNVSAREVARKPTMIGLGAVSSPPVSEASSPAAFEPPEDEGGGFFPKTDSEGDMPPPEDRTVMKQAAELLQDALREVGGSMDEVRAKDTPEARPRPKPAAGEPPTKAEPTKVAASLQPKPSPRPAEPRAGAPKPSAEGGRERDGASRRPPAKPAIPSGGSSDVATGRERRVSLAAPPEPSGGGLGRTILLLVILAVVAAVIFALTRQSTGPDQTAEPVPPTPPPSTLATAEPGTATETAAMPAEPEPSAAPPDSAESPPSAVEQPPVEEPTPAEVPAPSPPPPTTRPAPRPVRPTPRPAPPPTTPPEPAEATPEATTPPPATAATGPTGTAAAPPATTPPATPPATSKPVGPTPDENPY
ncbi:MAG: TIGR02266 family protein [Polyangiaceae bacterium]|nr:TIGR02266 family protein [Polyangiaceae bacterium]